MFRSFFPNVMIASTYDIDFEDYFKQGYRLLLFDIDNTLVCHGAPQNEKSLPFLQGLLDMGYKIRFLSNNKEPRVASFTKPLKGNVGYIFKAGKPSIKSYIRAIDETGESLETTIFTGDQLFTDVWGANRAGVYSILVKPIDKREEIQIVLKRRLEAIVLASYKRFLKKRDKYGLIGDPVNHSKSPLIHNGWAAMRKDPVIYSLFEVKADKLQEQIEYFHKEGIKGFNITIPHKSAIIPFLDFVSPEALKIGAVNTVKIEKGKLYGINTDFSGLRRDFKNFNIKTEGENALILGAGGAARAVAAMLITEGAKNVYVINRTYEKAEEFCKDMNERFETRVCRPVETINWNTLPDKLVCVQTTSLGLHGEDAPITDEAFYKKLAYGYDIVPMLTTDFTNRCKANNVPSFDGFGMLVNQAADAYEFWRGCELKEAEAAKIRRRLSNG